MYDCIDYEGVPYIDATATPGDDGSVTVFCVNRDMENDFHPDVNLHSFGKLRPAEHIMMHHDDVKAVNTGHSPHTVSPTPGPGGTTDGETASIKIPALSWNVIRFDPIPG